MVGEILDQNNSTAKRVPANWQDDSAWPKLAVEHSLLHENLRKWRPHLSKPNQAVKLGSVSDFAEAIDKCLADVDITGTDRISRARLQVVHTLMEWPRTFFYEYGNRKRGDRKSNTQFLKDRTKNLEITRSTLIEFLGRHDYLMPKPLRRHLLACLKEEIGLSKRIEAGWDSHFKKRQPLTGKSSMIKDLFKILTEGGQSATVIDAAIEDLLLKCFGINKAGKTSGDGIRATRNRKPRTRS